MGRKKIVKEKQLLAAIVGSRGVVSTIAERLGMNWHTVRHAIDENEKAREALAAEEESALDFVENKAYERIEAGDGTMIRFYLATKGKKRGYTYEERIEDNDAENDEPLQVICDGEEVDPQPINAETETAQPNAEADA
jgi:predicted transcriptional regulator